MSPQRLLLVAALVLCASAKPVAAWIWGIMLAAPALLLLGGIRSRLPVGDGEKGCVCNGANLAYEFRLEGQEPRNCLNMAGGDGGCFDDSDCSQSFASWYSKAACGGPKECTVCSHKLYFAKEIVR